MPEEGGERGKTPEGRREKGRLGGVVWGFDFWAGPAGFHRSVLFPPARPFRAARKGDWFTSESDGRLLITFRFCGRCGTLRPPKVIRTGQGESGIISHPLRGRTYNAETATARAQTTPLADPDVRACEPFHIEGLASNGSPESCAGTRKGAGEAFDTDMHGRRRRIWSHRYKRWRNGGWKQLPDAKLYGEYRLVNLVGLIPSIASARKQSS